jgi:di/tricarboxylate transporter
MGRLSLLVPIVMAFADRLALPEGSRGRTGLVVTLAFASFVIPTTILPANIPNMVLVGAAETQLGLKIPYLDYLALHFPVLGLLKAAILALLAGWLYRDRIDPAAREARRSPPLAAGERRLAVILVLALAFWATDVLHGISPAWVALAAAVLCLLPGSGLVPPNAFNDKVNFGSIFYIAGILGLGALIEASGVGAVLSRLLLAHLPLAPGHDLGNFLSLGGLAVLIGLATTQPNVPAVLTPLAPGLAEQAGWPLMSVVMAEVIGFSTVVLPYQAPPIIVGLAMGGVPAGKAVRLSLALTAATVLVLIPLDFAWWWLLGYFG